MIVYEKSKQGARRGRASGRDVCPAFGSGGTNAKIQSYCQVDITYAIRVIANYFPLWLSLALALSYIILPRIAYAQPEIEVAGNWAGYENGETYKGWVVVDSPNAYTSSIVLIGEYSKLIQVDSTMYAKLSDPVKGGAFYSLTQKWKHIGSNKSGTYEYYPSWLAATKDFADGLNVVYGFDRNWACVVTTTEVANALRDFNRILEGGDAEDDDPSGGDAEDVPSDGDYVYLKWTEIVDENVSLPCVGVAVDKQFYLRMIENWNNNNKDYGLYIAIGRHSSYYETYNFYRMGAKDKPEINDAGNIEYENYTNKSGGSYGNIEIYNNESYIVVTLSNTIYTSALTEQSGTYSNYGPYTAYYWSKGGNSGGGDDTPITPVDPPDDPIPTEPSPTAPEPPTPSTPNYPNPVAPDPPTTPEPPEVPQPTVIVEPDPVYIEIPTGTTSQDYTPWLRAILLQLQYLCTYFADFAEFLAEQLENHCVHIREHMSECTENLEDYFGELLYQYVDDLTMNIAQDTYWLGRNNKALLQEHHDYLEQLAQWVVDNLNWQGAAGEYDDSNVLYWLKRIWAKQGSGTVNTKPTDPVTNYNFYVTWIGSLFDDIGIDLTGTDLDPLIQSITGLANVFPFSIPWNIIAVFGLLTATPVTPSFDFTIPDTEFFDGYTYEIDMAWLDGAMASVRAIELLAFCCYVLVHTKDFCGFLLGDDA